MMRRIVIVTLVFAAAFSYLPMLNSTIESTHRPVEYLNWQNAGIAVHRVDRSLVVTHKKATSDGSVFLALDAILSERQGGKFLFRNASFGVTLLAIPLACFPILFSAYPLFVGLRALHRRHDLESELCQCGYNLTGNTTGVCPECGKSA